MAIDIGKSVRKGSATKMDDFISSLFIEGHKREKS